MAEVVNSAGAWLLSLATDGLRSSGHWLQSHTPDGMDSRGMAALVSAATGLVATTVYLTASPSFGKRHESRPSHQFHENDPDVIIIGSGVAGSALATVLAREGRRVTVLERDMKEPDRIVGELLQPGGVIALKKLGLEDSLWGIDAQTLNGFNVHNMATQDTLPLAYPSAKSEEEPIVGTTFHHGRFIMGLRKLAMKEPNVTYIEGPACQLLEENGVVVGVRYRLKGQDDVKQIYAPLTFAADGNFSKFRKDQHPESPETCSHFVGFMMKPCPQKIPRHADLILAKPNPIWFYQISSECTRSLVDIRGPLPKNLKDFLMESIYPQLPEHFKESFKDGVNSSRVRPMPCRYLPAYPMKKPGLVILGDAYNVRHPITGGGMSVALYDVMLWKDLLRSTPDLEDSESVMKLAQRFHKQRKLNHSLAVNILAQAIYELFSATDEHILALKDAAFQYFGYGGQCTAGVMNLFSTLNPSLLSLVGHFHAVAAIAVYRGLKVDPVWALHRKVYRSAKILTAAYRLLLTLLWGEL